MPRKARELPTPADDDFNHERLEEANIAAQQWGKLQTDYNDERDLLNQLIGRTQMAQSIARFAEAISVVQLKQIKETKAYRALSGKRGVDPDGNEIPNMGTFDGFCRAIGLSRSKVDEDIENLTAFGEEALKNLSAVGAGYRELRQLRRLPDDQRAAIIEVAQSGDKDSFEEMAENLIASHEKEKAALIKRAEEAEADLDASRAMNEQKTRTLEQLNQELYKAKRHIETMTPEDVGAEIRKEVAHRTAMAEVGIRQLRAGFDALMKHKEETGIDHEEFLSGCISQLMQTLNELSAEYMIKHRPDGLGPMTWLVQKELMPSGKPS